MLHPMLRVLAAVLMLVISGAAWGQSLTREQKVRQDRQKVEAEGFWIYNDLEKGFAEARRTGKPLLMVLRCIPCEECVKLDDDLIDQDPVVRPLLDKFVCVRQISTNGLDLTTFQYDTDQSFAVFLLNADGTIYGRFGTRSHRSDWLQDVSVQGMAAALEGALQLHEQYPANRESLQGKRGPQPLVATPEQFPSLRDKYTDQLNLQGAKIVASCIHCHQIGDAERNFYRSAGEPIPDKVLFPYPHPKTIGLTLDPEQRATVTAVADQSIAAQAGFVTGDEIIRLEGQPMLSTADVQWVLHQVDPAGGNVSAEIRRGEETQNLTLRFPADWRLASDLSWRASTWGLRRMASGGMTLEPVAEEEREQLKLPSGAMGLRVRGVGQWGAHAAAKNAGFRKDDVIIRFDGRSDLLDEAALLRHGVRRLKPGDKVAVTVLRQGQPVELTLPMQE